MVISKLSLGLGAVLGALAATGYMRAKKKVSKPKLQVIYFDIAGKAEGIRLACAHAGLEFEDRRVTREEFATLKEEGKLAFAQLPALVVDDKHIIVQSAAIIRYIGKLSGLKI